MIELDKTKIYDLLELNNEELQQVLDFIRTEDRDWSEVTLESFSNGLENVGLTYGGNEWNWTHEKPTHNAKELFYTLENVQVDCRDLSEKQIKEMTDIFESKGYCYFENDKEFSLSIIADNSYLHIYEGEIIIDSMVEGLKEITYEKFMELFGVHENLKPLFNAVELLKEVEISPEEIIKYLTEKEVFLTPKQYKKLWKKS